ncbi:MAG: CoA transferase, partial [Acidimicrobiia bacterium]|nr:CoA transferase [Acidimicrobiia bacterium]
MAAPSKCSATSSASACSGSHQSPAPTRPTRSETSPRTSDLRSRGVSALEGLRVLEIGGGIAAPYATKLLCELGADVVKVEPAHGDPLRAWRRGALFAYLNGGKGSVVADLMTDDGRSWLYDTIANVDLVVESLGAGGCEAHGVDVEQLCAANAELALVRLSDFGQTGPYVGIPTSGLTLQSFGGWASPHGVPNRDPVQVGARIHECTAGTFAAASALTAVRAARLRGKPVTVDLSKMECLVGTLAYPMSVHRYTEDRARRVRPSPRWPTRPTVPKMRSLAPRLGNLSAAAGAS